MQVLIPPPELARHERAPVRDGGALGVERVLPSAHEVAEVHALLLQDLEG